MAIENYRKVKLIKLLELLRQHTDAQHPMTNSQVCAAMDEMGIPCDRRIISQDVAVLNDMGYEIMVTMIGHEKAYYVDDRSFSVPELKILIDAVHASSFITEKKSNELIEKLAALAGIHQAEVLKRNMVCFNTRKHSNEKILYTIDTLEEAILTQKKVIFLYFDLNENGERVYRRGGHHYVVEPVALVFNEDNYYMSCYSSRHDSTSNYRVDRMDGVEIIEEPCSEKALALRDQVATYTEQAFKMFGGQLEDVVLEFDRVLIGVVYDKFGESVKMIPSGENKCIATVKVRISPTFWGWLFQFAGQMKILSPTHLLEQYKEYARKAEL
ncbi:MAG: WYL domain-containing protein [Oscillospiraceae bacterium]|nr:WYL domain-containing protein [Oscillospiraceae bacterium]